MLTEDLRCHRPLCASRKCTVGLLGVGGVTSAGSLQKWCLCRALMDEGRGYSREGRMGTKVQTGETWPTVCSLTSCLFSARCV